MWTELSCDKCIAAAVHSGCELDCDATAVQQSLQLLYLKVFASVVSLLDACSMGRMHAMLHRAAQQITLDC